jgi:hypothetical protein
VEVLVAVAATIIMLVVVAIRLLQVHLKEIMVDRIVVLVMALAVVVAAQAQ